MLLIFKGQKATMQEEFKKYCESLGMTMTSRIQELMEKDIKSKDIVGE